MSRYIQAVKTYIEAHQKDISTAAPIVLVLLILVGIVGFATYKNMPHYDYQPVKACDLLTPAKAQDLLGDKVNGVDTKDPVVTGNTATSKCSYTDLIPNANQMRVAAIAVRSGVNDKGVQQNKADFAASQSNNDAEAVKDVGESAYFNKTTGQLNVLDGRRWIILSYGVGSTPEANTIDDAVKLAHKVLN